MYVKFYIGYSLVSNQEGLYIFEKDGKPRNILYRES